MDEWEEFDRQEAAIKAQQPIQSGYTVYNSNHRGYHNASQRNYKKDGFSRNWRRNDEKENGAWHENDIEDNNTITVPASVVGRIIGRGGSKIRELEGQTGARIQIREGEGDSKVVALIGNEEARKAAKDLISELVENRTAKTYTSVEPKSNSFVPLDWTALAKKSEEAQRERWAKCPPLKKNFYREHPEVATMDPKYVSDLRSGMNNITVKNSFTEVPIPNPVETFEQAFGDYPEIMGEIEKQGFKTPSPIQSQGWPVLLSGRDLIGIAQTGTGKTLAFLLPAFIHIDGQTIPREERGGANMLVIAPTRELAMQIEEEVKKYSYRGITSVCIYGGANRKEQINVVSAGVEIIIATPGRLNDLISAGIVDVSAVTYLVLDEADRMLDMGFEPQIRKVLLDIRPDRQCVMTSATWPTGVRSLAEKYMDNPVQVFVGSLDLAAVHSVTQTVVIVDGDDKRQYLDDFIDNLTPDDKVIVFVGRKTVASDITADLSLRGVICQSIHGDREQADREEAIRDLKSGEVRILISTDVASRGIDILDVTKVFNMDFPRNIEEYVHRVGRTGRAGRTGEAITLFTRSDWNFAGELIDILEEANQLVPEELFDMKLRYEKWRAKKEEENREIGRSFGDGRRDRFGGGGNRRGRW